jgi:hypothetical protein
MILTPGSPDAVSFTDDTSLPNVGCKVSIHAQVIRELSLDWYYRLLQRVTAHQDELKSSVVGEVFFSLSDFEQRSILGTLKDTRIHITDPRLYIARVEDALSGMIPNLSFKDVLARLDRARAEQLQRDCRRFISRSMLRDSPAERLKRNYRTWEYTQGLRIDTSQLGEPFCERKEEVKDFDLSPFEKKSNMVNILSPILSSRPPSFSVLLIASMKQRHRPCQAHLLSTGLSSFLMLSTQETKKH